MCGYFGNLHESPVVIDLLNQLGITLPYPQGQHYPRRDFSGLLTCENGEFRLSQAMWWYQLQQGESGFQVNEKVTSFNARDLDKPFWRNAIKKRRGLVFATELGESQGKQRYLMRGKTPFALGVVYKDWQKGEDHKRSAAVITRPPHARFSQYHDKSTPLFIPLDITVIRQWLDGTIENNLVVEELLSQPRLSVDLEVTEVKTYKRGEPLSEMQYLPADEL